VTVADTFISYRREDTSGYAGRLRDELEERLGRGRVFRDVDTLRPGQDFVHEIQARLARCTTFLVLIGRDWIQMRDAQGRRRLEQDDDYVRLEIETALARRDLLVVPVLVEGAPMPAAADLPASLTSLARRQAISLRDDTWEADVDRLASLIGEGRRASPPPQVPWTAALAAAGAAVLLGLWLLWPGGAEPTSTVDTGAAASRPPAADAPDAPDATAVPTAPAGSPPAAPAAPPPAAVATEAYAIRMPPRQEIAHGRLLFSLVSGSIAPHGAANELRLRFRISNEGRYPVHVSDASFRLVAGEQMFAATSGLNTALSGRYIDEAVVSFDVPPGVERAALRILQGDAAGDMMLDLLPTGRPPDDERAPPGDSLTRAIQYPVLRDPMPLVAKDGIALTARNLSGRRFANLERLRLSLAIENSGRYPWGTGSATVRLLAGDDLIAPFESPSEVVEPESRASFEYLFDVPLGTAQVTLRVALGDERVEKSFVLP
jgi:hypothetical protein